MEIYESNTSIEVKRTEGIRTKEIRLGDQIKVGHYTATCQTVTPKGALFLLDQYLDKAYPMGPVYTENGSGSYETSELRYKLNLDGLDEFPEELRKRMAPFDNGDFLRIPCFGEIFGPDHEDAKYFEPDGCEQWELMKDKKNRIAFRQDCWEWGWLQNKYKRSVSGATFATVAHYGYAGYNNASIARGVRLAFLIN